MEILELEDRLAEVMSAPRRERVERRRMAHIKKTSRNQQKGQLHHQLIENSVKEKTSSNLLAGKTDLPYKSLMKLEGHVEPVMSVDFHPVKMDLLCSCDRSGELRLWNVDKNVCTWISKGASRQIRFQPETGNLLAAAAANVLNLINVETQRLVIRLEGHVKDICSVCWDIS